MKKISLVIFFISLVSLIYFFTNWEKEKSKVEIKEEVESISVEIPENRQNAISFNDINYVYYYEVIKDSSTIKLFPNFNEKLASDKLKEAENCDILVNAGFYTKDSKPLGLFISEGAKLSELTKSSLVNGIYSINFLDTPRITKHLPDDPLRVALQSGPLLIENGYLLNVYGSENYERRSIAAVTGINESIFMIIFQEDGYLKGPTLEDLPKIINKINLKHSLQIADAINLDGGSASAFLTPSSKIKEYTNLGSYFCIFTE